LETGGDHVDTTAEPAYGQFARRDEPVSGCPADTQQGSSPRNCKEKRKVIKDVILRHNSPPLT
jgi:hypothetical protein